MHVVFLDAFCDLMQSGSYAWGATALVHMYENLNDTSKSTTRQLARYITLLQCSPNYMEWFYTISHPFMSSAQPEDPPRHPPMQHHDTFVELDVAQHPVAVVVVDEEPEDAHMLM
ncbi:hypothetical protein GmHk_06G016894 [Glycine max]|nr:hypothetical protein GmHk_06G016894 [Glycine max]